MHPSLNLRLSNFNGSGSTGYQGNANAGVDFPVNGGNLNLNADVSGYKGKWQDGDQSGHFGDVNIDRLAAMYSKFKDAFGVDFNPNDPLHNFMFRYIHNL